MISYIFSSDLLVVLNATFDENDFLARARNFFGARRFFAGARFFRAGRFFARARDFFRARRFFFAGAGFFNRAGGFFDAGAGFNNFTAGSFFPPPTIVGAVVDPLLTLNVISAIVLQLVALAFFHVCKASVVALVRRVVARAANEFFALRSNDDFAGAGGRFFARAGDFFRARRFRFFAGARNRFFTRAGERFFARARFFNRAGRFFAGARRFRFYTGARNFFDARSFNPPPALRGNVIDPLRNRICINAIRIEGVALAFFHFEEAGIITMLVIITRTVDKRNAGRAILSKSHCRGYAQDEGCYFGCFHLYDLF
jgi:hypothetical protein